LLNDRGLVMARAGNLRDSSMEVSLLSALTAIFGAGLKAAKYNHQESLDQYYVFKGGDQDLFLIPVDPSYSLLLAGNGLAARETVFDTTEAMFAIRNEVGRSLRSMGVTSELKEPAAPPAVQAAPPSKKKDKTGDLPTAPASPEMESMLKEAGKQKVKQEEMDAFWDQAAEEHANKSTNPDVLSYEEARKMGLTPDQKN
jgi:hypothetical protein